MLESSTRCAAKADGFLKQSTSDPCIYTSTTESDGVFILAVYVDDILSAGKSQQKIEQVKADLGNRFQLGELHYFLGVQQRTEGIWIGQPAYTQAVVKNIWHGMLQTTVGSGTKLFKATEESEMADTTLYQSAVGSMLHLSGWTRPDIPFAMSNVARFCSSPRLQSNVSSGT